MERRQFLKATGGIAAASTISLAAFSSTGAAAEATIQSQAPSAISNDRGDLSKITIDPSFRIEWQNMDTAVGKVFVLIEARTKEDGEYQGAGWSPIFRMMPWLTENKAQNGAGQVDYSQPGTTGHFEIAGSLSQLLRVSILSRDNGIDSFQRRPLEVVNETGRPDYSGIDFDAQGRTSLQTFMEGDSMGSASAYADIPELVNNFPGTDAGYYGSAINTDNFDVPEDGQTDSDTVELRYTFALYTANWASAQEDGEGVTGGGWMENVRPEDLQTDSQGNSVLVMNGEDGYPDITTQGNRIQSPAAVHYPTLQSIAGDHPSVVTTTTSFPVTVTNEKAESGGGLQGQSNTGAEGSGQ